MKIISLVGARPNFMKIAPFIKAIEKYNAQPETWNLPAMQGPSRRQEGLKPVNHILVHTGQHYDDRMSRVG